jgi:hypothetical protein
MNKPRYYNRYCLWAQSPRRWHNAIGYVHIPRQPRRWLNAIGYVRFTSPLKGLVVDERIVAG